VMQAKRQRVVGDIANGILVLHVLCCFNLFSNAFLNALQLAMRDDDDDQKVCCEWSYEEDTSRICNHVYEYQQMQMKEDIEHIDKDDDRFPKCNADETFDEEIIDEILITDAEKAKPENDRTHYDNSSRSNASSVVAQDEMKSEKAQAGLKAFKDYDYRVECEGKKRKC